MVSFCLTGSMWNHHPKCTHAMCLTGTCTLHKDWDCIFSHRDRIFTVEIVTMLNRCITPVGFTVSGRLCTICLESMGLAMVQKNQNSSAILMHDLVGGHGFTGLALGYWLLLLLRVLVPSVNISQLVGNQNQSCCKSTCFSPTVTKVKLEIISINKKDFVEKCQVVCNWAQQLDFYNPK